MCFDKYGQKIPKIYSVESLLKLAGFDIHLPGIAHNFF